MKLAVIEIKSHQYLVKEGDKIESEKVEGKKGQKILCNKVLFLVDEKNLEIGNPYLPKKVEAKILDQIKTKKVIVFKYKPKTRYRKKGGHRQQKTILEITKIPDV